MALVFLRKQQLLLFLQDATHLVTKWRNRLLLSTAELCIGSKAISVNHLYDIIDNPAFTKFDHCLTKTDINPKDRQNFNSCLKITNNGLLRILSENVNTQGTFIYLQMLKMIIVAYVEKATTITEHIEQLIADAYDDAVTIYDDLEVLDILEQKHVLGLNSLSAYIFEHLNTNSQMYNFSSQVDIIDSEEFELAAADDEDINSDNSTYEDSSSDNDHTDDEEQEITTKFINTTKRDFFGTKVYDTIKPGVQNTYFKVLINNQTKYLHKRSACWLLTDETNKLSNDRLLGVMQNRREE
ncbi:unnamed protein product [Rotaria sp. Silwood2]|nr:unnamed protein product [Rotaria sp. Silwood2]